MRKTSILGVLLLAAALLLSFAPAAMADITGNYSGQWKCTPPDCVKPGGAMHGNITQNGGNYGGSFTLENTTVGTLTGTINATLQGNQFNGTISNSEGTINFQGNISGNTLNGSFNGPLGNGTFSVNKQ
ncbi:MAG: hypothetical protein K9K66_10480 [Desulfarculaceae bacterium]|nr:hypothetical protein [Desulfarculaceae bacterium]MCF8073921.1 hypothetical protein [Desulfarculaceae bacterium]MCF8102074.1 hypothetical protein [Desulfarculaceae bacterium]MCF8116345.1 hypothetical protein [Desulfarculaceae bacterium]